MANTDTKDQKQKDKVASLPMAQRIHALAEKASPVFPWIVAGLYFIVMAFYTFRYHTIGDMGVETDFYVELVPQAQKLLAGIFSPENYGAKGPVYSLLLAAFTLVAGDYFIAGLIINLVSGAAFIVALYFLIVELFNRLTASLVIVAVTANAMFLSYTYQAASDLSFMALCALSMLFLIRGTSTRGLVLSAVFGAAAFLNRYNGAFIIAGSLVWIAFQEDALKIRLKRAVLWLAVFVGVGLPWYIPNAIVMGSPVHNNNYMNVMLEYYGNVSDTDSYETWTKALPEDFESLSDIIFYDPVYFVKHSTENICNHFISDMRLLTGWPLAIFIVPGLILIFFAGLDRRKLAFFSFGAFYFLILVLVFYNSRFSLFLLVFYLPIAIWPFTSDRAADWLSELSFPGSAAFFVVTLIMLVMAFSSVTGIMKSQPPFLEELKELGVALDSIESDKSKKLAARKPHTAYFAGLEAVMFPADVMTVDDLVGWLKVNHVDYVLYSGIEAKIRPSVEELLSIDKPHPGLVYVTHNRFGVIYKVFNER